MRIKPRRILIVDDEATILLVLARTLQREGHEVVTANGPQHALIALQEKGPFDLAISDNQMPGMSGVHLLAEMRDRHPEMIRILLTGHADVETAMRAINQGQIFRFLTKPWDNAAMKVMLASAFAQLDLDREHRRLIAQARGLADKLSVMA